MARACTLGRPYLPEGKHARPLPGLRLGRHDAGRLVQHGRFRLLKAIPSQKGREEVASSPGPRERQSAGPWPAAFLLGGIGAAPTPGLIQHLQRTAGNSSTAAFIQQAAKVASASPLPGSPKSEVQRMVNLDTFLGKNSKEKLKEYELS